MIIDSAYDIGEFVFLITDEDQIERIITELIIQGNNNYKYKLAVGTFFSEHSEFEFTREPSISKKYNTSRNG